LRSEPKQNKTRKSPNYDFDKNFFSTKSHNRMK
jgi:hypothetical protein